MTDEKKHSTAVNMHDLIESTITRVVHDEVEAPGHRIRWWLTAAVEGHYAFLMVCVEGEPMSEYQMPIDLRSDSYGEVERKVRQAVEGAVKVVE